MKTQAVLQPGRLTPTLQESERWGHTAVHPVVQDVKPAAEKLTRLNTDQNFSHVPVYHNGNSQIETACPLSPRTCPFGGACHTCPVHIQPKLKISQPDDEYEREADRVADAVMRMPDLKDEDKEKCPASGCAPVIQRRATGRETPEEIPPIVHEALRSPGRPLESRTRAFMEPRFGLDFSRVRIHTDTKAANSAQAISASAYTLGPDIVFGEGKYAPQTNVGQRLLAHELAHAVQASMGPSSSPSSTDVVRRVLVTPLGLGGGYGGLMERDRRRTLGPATRTFALTFDDGPHAAELGSGKNYTEKVLDTLKTKGIKAGFFIQTQALDPEGRPFRGSTSVGRQLINRMGDEGHTIGIHTGGPKGHILHPEAQKTGQLEGELEGAKKFIQETTKTEKHKEVIEPTFVRPPEGRVAPKTGTEAEKMSVRKSVLATYRKVGLTNLLWDIDGDQGQNLSLDVLKGRIKDQMRVVQQRGWKSSTASPNIIVLYHDIVRSTAENIGTLIDHIVTTTRELSDGKDDATFAAP